MAKDIQLYKSNSTVNGNTLVGSVEHRWTTPEKHAETVAFSVVFYFQTAIIIMRIFCWLQG